MPNALFITYIHYCLARLVRGIERITARAQGNCGLIHQSKATKGGKGGGVVAGKQRSNSRSRAGEIPHILSIVPWC